MRTSIKTQCAALAVLAFASVAVEAAETLSVVTFGGAYEAAAKKAYFEPFTQATGVNFSTESYDGGLAKLSAMEQAKNTTWDLIDLETNDAITACDEGLLMKFDKKSLGKTSDFIPGSISDCAVASMVWSTVYAYDASKLKTPPTTVNDFFDLQKFPGKRGLRKSPKVTMEWALIADGVDPKNVYKVLGTPAGVDRAFKKLDTIKQNIVWWEAGAQAPQLLADGAGRDDAGLQRPHRRCRQEGQQALQGSLGMRRCTTSNGGAFRRAPSTPTRPRSSSSPLRSRKHTRT